MALAATAAADPASRGARKNHLAATKLVAPAPSAPATAIPGISSISSVPAQVKFLSPFELDYSTRLAQSLTAAPPDSQTEPDVRPGEPTGPLDQAAQVDSYGLLPSHVHSQAPPLVSIGDWNFSAAAHVPVTRGRDTGAAISAQHEF